MAGDEDADWRADVEEEREWREELYKDDETPLSAKAREAFKGLTWFPVDPKYRLRGVRLDRLPTPKGAMLAATGEDSITMVEVGSMSFKLAGKSCKLLVYEPAPGESEEPYLFVPFKDATSGNDTYGGGRYLDFEPREDDEYELDFNRAYHPYCVFDEEWACILPPPENALPVRVEAGEKL